MVEPAFALGAKIEPVETETTTRNRTGVAFPRYFTARLEAGKTPYDDIQWETRTASIGNDKGDVIFEQRDVEVPVDWSQTATNIVASKYFHGKLGSPDRETSVAQLVERVVDAITSWGKKDGYFRSEEDGESFRCDLAHLMLTQKACFNSPVWFNVGVKEARGYGDLRSRAWEDRQVGKGRGAATVLGVFYRSGERFAGIDSRFGEDRRHETSARRCATPEPADRDGLPPVPVPHAACLATRPRTRASARPETSPPSSPPSPPSNRGCGRLAPLREPSGGGAGTLSRSCFGRP